ncbi:MAG: ATP-binding cassette domain-containing protein, partial [Patescibacteria group bacterium]
MAKDNVVLRFENVTFEYAHKKPLIEEVSFSIRQGAKFTLMGQNGAGKSSLFKMIMGEITPQSGRIAIDPSAKIAIGRQVIPKDELDLTVEEFFAKCFSDTEWKLGAKIKDVLEVVNLPVPPMEKKIREFSG